MRTIIEGKVYDTETAEQLLHVEWWTHHPNLSGGPDTLRHERALYRTKKGKLFAYEYDDRGYGRNRDGASGAFVDTNEAIEPLAGEGAALHWAEETYRFDAHDIEQVLIVEEA